MPNEVFTHCPYCALQCGMKLAVSEGKMALVGNDSFPVNKGALCIKGWTAASALNHPHRLLAPLVRNARGALVPATWDEALSRVARAFKEIQARHGPDAVGVFGSGALTNEKVYLIGKFARLVLGTSSIDYNGRFCMSSAAAASMKALGIDRGLPFPLEDITGAEVILLVGSNAAETLPPIMHYFERQRENGGRLIVVDPRRTPTAEAAWLHLQLTPGSDVALANGLLHILVRDGLIDERYIRERTEGFELAKCVVAAYWPARVERLTGVPESHLVRAARALGSAKTAMVLTGRGPEQQSTGVDSVLAYINLALALGLVGKPMSGYGCLTGQGNGQGGREHGQKADQLPGYRRIDDPAARKHIAQLWGIAESQLPGPGKSAYELLNSLGQKVRALLIMGSNPVVSSPNALLIAERLAALDFLAVADFFLSETAQLADVILASAQWAEEEGTMTNLEGRVILRKRALDPPEGVRTDIEILCGLAAQMGKAEYFNFASPRDVFDELRKASAGGPADYSGITYEKIEASNGIFWPCPSADHPGTERLFSERFPTPNGRARFHPVRHRGPTEEICRDYPLYLTTGRLLAHYQSGAQTRRIAELTEQAPEPTVEVHPATARRYGLSEGDLAQITTRRGRALFKVKVTTSIRQDTIFVPFHWGGDQSANRLTNVALDPVSKMPPFKVCAARIERFSPDGGEP
jgi:assimilatory nitrate reductase catalytic subunit